MIEHREFERLGGRRTINVDARLIALTNADLKSAVDRRAFREDLFYRLNVVQIAVPSLRERGEDLERLSRAFLKTYAEKHGRPVKKISREALGILVAYDFPGNVRELANIIERAVIVSLGAQIEATDWPEALRASAAKGSRRNRRPTLAEIETEYILETLAATKGNKKEAATILGISRKNLYERLARMKGKDEGGRRKDEG